MSKSVLLCISTLLDGGNRTWTQIPKMGAAFNLRTLGPWSYSSRARADYSKMFNLSDSLGRPLFANIQVRAPTACLASVRSSDTPHPAPKDLARLLGVPEDRRARKVRRRTCIVACTRCRRSHPCLSARAGARTSSPRYGITRLSEKRALHSPTLLLSRFADAALAVLQQDGNRQGHSRRCAYVFPCWSPDAELVCAQN